MDITLDQNGFVVCVRADGCLAIICPAEKERSLHQLSRLDAQVDVLGRQVCGEQLLPLVNRLGVVMKVLV